MEKILCSREPYDSIIGQNRPNGTSRTWNMQEGGKIPTLLHTLTPDIINSYIEDPALYNDQHYSLSFHEDYEDVEIEDIGDNKHIYIIRVYNHDFFRLNLDTGFSCISKLVLEDIKIGKCALIIECTTEGKYTRTANTELDIVERWRVKAELPEYSVSVIHGNLICDTYVKANNLKINAYGCSAFETFFSPPDEYLDDEEKIVPFDAKISNPQKYFLSYNRQPRNHRLLFGYLLWQEKLINKGLISLKFPKNKTRYSAIYTGNVINENSFNRFRSEGERTIDISTVDNLATNFTLSNYESTLLSVISETVMDPGCIFFSEKIWKPISVGHPFILMGSPFSLEKLKDMGYMTYESLWDESYDKIVSEADRVIAITKLLKSITQKSDDELNELKLKSIPIAKHNRKVFREYISREYKGRENLHGVILPITNITKKIYNKLGYTKDI